MVAARWRRGPVFVPRIWSSKWDRKLAHGSAKTAIVVSNFGRWVFVILRVCGAIRRPPVTDPRPPINQPRLAHEAAQPATPQSHGVQRWPGERGGRSGTRHMTANSTVSAHCPPNVVPLGGPFFGAVFQPRHLPLGAALRGPCGGVSVESIDTILAARLLVILWPTSAD